MCDTWCSVFVEQEIEEVREVARNSGASKLANVFRDLQHGDCAGLPFPVWMILTMI